MNIELRGMDELRKRMGALQGDMREIMSTALVAGANQLEGYVKVNIRDRGLVDTANLMNSWSVEREDMRAVLYTPVVHAAIHEYGGVIKAHGGGFLTFQTKDGTWHRVRSVNMPARPYLRPAVDEHEEEIMQSVRVNFERLVLERLR